MEFQISEPAFTMFFFFVLPLFLLGYLIRTRRKLPYPPGPRGIPLLGNVLQMDQLTHRGLANLAKRYGRTGLFHIRIGFLHMIHVSTPDTARQVLQVKDSVFCNRPINIAIKYLSYDQADMAFANYGPLWRQMRKICVMKVFSKKRVESWSSVRDEVQKMIRTVSENNGSPVNIGELVLTLTMNITYTAAFGSVNLQGQDEFVSILQEFSKLFVAFNIADFIPWLGWVDPFGFYKRLAKVRHSLDRFIDVIIDEHVEKHKKNLNGGDEVDSDMVDDLLAYYDGDGIKKRESDDLQTSITLTRDNIKAIIMDVMFGGTETVASAIEWAMAELMKNPDELKRVQEELNEVVGMDRRVNETDLEKLTYLKLVTKETLRLHPPIPLPLHETTEDTEVNGYLIPARSRVMVNVWAIGRDEAWEDPDTFNPSRFLKEGAADFMGNNFEFIPFGSGRRSCPGMQLGLYALELGVANLVHCFSWELPNGMTPSELDMMDISGLTAPRANRLVAVPSPRLNCPLF